MVVNRVKQGLLGAHGTTPRLAISEPRELHDYRKIGVELLSAEMNGLAF